MMFHYMITACFISFSFTTMLLIDHRYHLLPTEPKSYGYYLYNCALFQDIFFVLYVLKMFVIDNESLDSLVDKVRNPSPVLRLYGSSVLILHGILLCDEPVNQVERLTPALYTPHNISKETMELFWL